MRFFFRKSCALFRAIETKQVPKANGETCGERSDVVPLFWWDVKQLTVLQYAIHEFQVFGPRDSFKLMLSRSTCKENY